MCFFEEYSSKYVNHEWYTLYFDIPFYVILQGEDGEVNKSDDGTVWMFLEMNHPHKSIYHIINTSCCWVGSITSTCGKNGLLLLLLILFYASWYSIWKYFTFCHFEIRIKCVNKQGLQLAISIYKRHNTSNNCPYVTNEKIGKDKLKDSKANQATITPSIIHATADRGWDSCI